MDSCLNPQNDSVKTNQCLKAVSLFIRCLLRQTNELCKPSRFAEINLSHMQLLFKGRSTVLNSMGTGGGFYKFFKKKPDDYSWLACEDRLFDWILYSFEYIVKKYAKIKALPDDHNLLKNLHEIKDRSKKNKMILLRSLKLISYLI